MILIDASLNFGSQMNALVFHWENVDIVIRLFSLHLGFIRAQYRWWSLLTPQHPWAEKTSTSDVGGRGMLGEGRRCEEFSWRCLPFSFSFFFIFFKMAWGFLVWLWIFSVAEIDLQLLPPPPESYNTPSLHSTRDQTQGLVHARQMLHHLCIPPELQSRSWAYNFRLN